MAADPRKSADGYLDGYQNGYLSHGYGSRNESPGIRPSGVGLAEIMGLMSRRPFIPPHGTRARYHHRTERCRASCCAEANAEYLRRWRARRAAEGKRTR